MAAMPSPKHTTSQERLTLARRSRGTTDADLRQITAAGAQLTGQVRIGAAGRLEGELHASAPDMARTAADAGLRELGL